MNDIVYPQLAQINLANGVIVDPETVIERRLSDMADHYQDQEAVKELLSVDPVIYRVYMPKQPGKAIGLYTATSIIEPGVVGEEYYMTKGHFHIQEAAPEVYLTLQGEGMLVMQTRSGRTDVQEMKCGVVNYIPGTWAHRTVNTGPVPLVFFATWPVDAGHDYESISDSGFDCLVFTGNDGPRVVNNQ
jgi:glucose-6-phosphate isomerase